MLKRTPIYEEGEGPEADGWLAAAPLTLEGARLSDHSGRGKILVEGAGAPALLSQLWELPEMAPTGGAPLPAGYAFCLRPDRYFLSLPAGAEAAVGAQLATALRAGNRASVTDVTHGRAELWLQGSAAPTLLSYLCGLDVHPDAFPDLTAKESSVARTHQLILRHDRQGEPAYALVGDRSLGLYLWQTIVETGERRLEIGSAAHQPLSSRK